MEKATTNVSEVNTHLAVIMQQLAQEEGYPYSLEMLKRALQNISKGRFDGVTFPVWKTITLGTGLPTGKDLREELEVFGYYKDADDDHGTAARMLHSDEFAAENRRIKVDLVVVSPYELGFQDEAEYTDICMRAKRFDLELCPAEVGPQLRLQYEDQPQGEVLQIAMEPFAAGYQIGKKFVFCVTHHQVGPRLTAMHGGYLIKTDERLVFVLHQKIKP